MTKRKLRNVGALPRHYTASQPRIDLEVTSALTQEQLGWQL